MDGHRLLQEYFTLPEKFLFFDLSGLEALEEGVKNLGIAFNQTLAVGDGANDLAMIQRAGLGVAYHAKPVVAQAAGAAIQHNDLTALLYLQGYTDAEIVQV